MKSILALAALVALLGACGNNDPGQNNAQPDMADMGGVDMDTTGRPVAVTSPNRMVQTGEEVVVRGSESYDPDGDVLMPRWTVTVPEGSALEFGTITAFSVTFRPDVAGDYIFELVVNDGQQDSAPARTTIRATGDPVVNNDPVADAGEARTLPLGQQVQLDGSGSSDPDGDRLTFAWSLTSAPNGSAAGLDDTTLEKPSFTPDVAGEYTFSLVVRDGRGGESAADTVVITILPENSNTPPVADAGLNKTGQTNAAITLDGSASSDVDGDPLTYTWTITESPAGSTPTLSAEMGVTVDFMADVPGSYKVQLVVNDGEEDSQPDELTIDVSDAANQPPVANAGADQRVQIGNAVQLDGSGSSDPEGDALTYAWTIINKPAGSTALLQGGTSATPTLTPDREGEYELELRVRDGRAFSAPDTVKVTATINAPDCLIISEYVEGSGSNKAFELFNCGGVALDMTAVGVCLITNASTSCTNTVTLTGTLDPGGVHSVCNSSLTGEPAGGCTQDLNTVTAFNGNDRLIIFADLDGDGAYGAGDTVYDAFGEPGVDPGSNIWAGVTYRRCDFTPYLGTGPFDVNAYFRAESEDDFTNLGAAPTPGCAAVDLPPVASAGVDAAALVGELVQLDGSGSTDPEGATITYQWALMTPGGSAATLSDATAAQPTFSPDVAGDYVATLVVNDGGQDSQAAVVTITVTAPPDCLLISELVAGSASNQAVEVSNCGALPVDLSRYGVCVVVDGATDCTATIALSGTLAAGAAHGVCATGFGLSVDAGDCAQTSAALTLDGDDRLLLFRDEDASASYNAGDVVIDAFGTPVGQPGSPVWAGATFRRCNVAPFTGQGDFVAAYYYESAAQDDVSTFGDAPAGDCATNRGPVASAGSSRAVLTGGAVSLDGSGSTDADGDTLTYQWTLSAPAGSTATLSDATAAQPTFTADVDGAYRVELVVYDGHVFSPEANITITAQAAGAECLIISEYIEGSSNNKAIELYNCGTAPTVGGSYGVCLRSNAATSGCTNTLILADPIASGAVVGVCNGGFNLASGACAITNQVTNFNGDDRLFVFRDADGNGSFDEGSDPVLDAFGLLGTAESGRTWENMTLRRCNFSPFDGTGTFDFTTYYTQHPNDDVADFGVVPVSGCP